MDTRRPIRERVLVVDDDPLFCPMVGKILTAEGYQPIICTHPRDALVISEQANFELAFIDVNLPEMSGLELASTLKHRIAALLPSRQEYGGYSFFCTGRKFCGFYHLIAQESPARIKFGEY